MSSSKYPLPGGTHPLLRAVLDDWRLKAGVLSAPPDAPVGPDAPRPRWLRRPTWSSRRADSNRREAPRMRRSSAGKTCSVTALSVVAGRPHGG